MRTWRALVLVGTVAVAGAIGTLLVGAAIGMGARDLLDLAAYLAPAIVVTVLTIAIARPLLVNSSIRQRFVAVAGIAAVTAMANLFVLARTMFVNNHDATLVGVLLLYSIGAGVGAALVLARSTGRDIARLADTARSLGRGELKTRVGELNGGRELGTLAGTLDEMAERLQSATAREREIEATRRDLMSAVSHDLRTPLASLRAMVEAIDDGVVEDLSSVRRYVGEMRRSVEALVAMVDDLFEIAQLDAGAIEAETERVRLGDVVRSVVATVRMSAEDKGLRLETRLGGAEDAECSPRLERVLQNLLVNAVRHTPADGTVRIEASHDAEELELAVADTGEGIASEDLAHVFDPFFRADPARSGGGTGLGLALAKRIVETLGGQIDACSEPTKGARFEVRIPSRLRV